MKALIISLVASFAVNALAEVPVSSAVRDFYNSSKREWILVSGNCPARVGADVYANGKGYEEFSVYLAQNNQVDILNVDRINAGALPVQSLPMESVYQKSTYRRVGQRLVYEKVVYRSGPGTLAVSGRFAVTTYRATAVVDGTRQLTISRQSQAPFTCVYR